MINKKIGRTIALMMAAASFTLCSPSEAEAEWKYDSSGSWYSEGSSWATGWRNIDNSWYYFKSDGYMAKSSIIDEKYFVDADGRNKSMNEEVEQYAQILDYYGKIKEEDYNYENLFFDNTVLDIDQDGTYEMLVNNGTCEADRNITMYKYKDGELYTDEIPAGHSTVSAYNSSSKKILIAGGHMGYVQFVTYTLDNNKLVKIDEINGSIDSGEFQMNGENVSMDYVKNKLAQDFRDEDYIDRLQGEYYM